ncbi:UNVERIFIED_CONTAM: hypothetical protein Sradi_3690300 [Sesamum radiatum]|uniref:Uncharacterized protein n=1 Tax=Sesamum radiatum TaxID=300843 RepID=A0AAW2PX40_SESRA
MPPSSFRPCSCSVEDSVNTVPSRAWLVFKESSYGSVAAPYRALEGGELSVETENEGVNDVENVKARVQRRQRSGGGGVGAVVVGEP